MKNLQVDCASLTDSLQLEEKVSSVSSLYVYGKVFTSPKHLLLKSTSKKEFVFEWRYHEKDSKPLLNIAWKKPAWKANSNGKNSISSL